MTAMDALTAVRNGARYAFQVIGIAQKSKRNMRTGCAICYAEGLKMRKYNSSHEYYKATKKKARRNGLLWNQDEIDMILEMEYDDMQLSELIGRTVEAIHVKRCRVRGIQDAGI